MIHNGRAAGNTRENPSILVSHFRKDCSLRAACSLCKSEISNVVAPQARGA